MGPLVALLTVLAVCTNAQESTNIIGINQELIYDYQGHVHAGTKNPAEFGSEYYIKGKLHLQGLEQYQIGVTLRNISYQLHNGQIHHQLKSNKFVDVPIKAEILSKPFMIQYNSNGQIIAMKFSSQDKDWSMNFKRALGSMLQVDKKLAQKEMFDTTIEDSIYGLCSVTYDWVPEQKNESKLIKIMDLSSCHNDYDSELNGGDSNRVYYLRKQGDFQLHIVAVEGMSQMLMQSKSVVTSIVKTSQKLEMLSVGEAINKITIEQPELLTKSLKYVEPTNNCRNFAQDELFDATGEIVDEIDNLMEDLIEFMNTTQVRIEAPSFLNSQIVQRLVLALERANSTTLNEYFSQLTPADQEPYYQNLVQKMKLVIFLKLLPSVGSSSSAVFVRNLIVNNTSDKEFQNSIAVQLLDGLTINLKCPNEQILHELEVLMDLKTTDSAVGQAGILAFSILIKRTFENDISNPELEKWIGMFVQKLKGNETEQEKLLLLQGLANIEIGSVFKHLKNIVLESNLEFQSRLKVYALKAMKSTLIKQPKLMIQVCWPIITNRRLDTLLRLTAYSIYVQTNEPTLSRFMPLNWFMQSEKNEYITNFHFNTLVTFSQLSNDPKLCEIAKTILPHTKSPIEKIEGHGIYLSDYYAIDNFGFQIETLSIQSESTILTEMRAITKSNFEISSLLFTHKRKLFNYSILDWILGSFSSVDIIVKNQGYTTSVLASTRWSLTYFWFGTLPRNNLIAKGFPTVSIPFRSEIIIPNDLGLPVKSLDNLGLTLSVNMGEEDRYRLKGHEKFKLKIYFHGARTTGIEVYNPLVDLWHGSQELKTGALSIPFTLESIFGNRNVTLIWKRISNNEVIGLTVHTQNQVYVNGPNSLQILKQFPGELSTHEVVTRGSDYRKNILLAEYKSQTFGKKLEVQIFDCEDVMSRGTVINQLKEGYLENTIRNIPEATIIAEILAFKRYIVLTPGIGNCGLSTRLLPLDTQSDHFVIEIGSPNKTDRNLGDRNLYTNVLVKSANNLTLNSYSAVWYISTYEKKREATFGVKANVSELGIETSRGDFEIKLNISGSIIDINIQHGMGEGDNYGSIQTNITGMFSNEQEMIMNNSALEYAECRQNGPSSLISNECVKVATGLRKIGIKSELTNSQNSLIQKYLSRYLYFGYRNMEYVLNARNWNNNFKMIMDDLVKSNNTEIDIVLPVIPGEWNLITRTDNYETKFIGMPILSSSILKYLNRWNFWYTDFYLWSWFSSFNPAVCVVGHEKFLNINMTMNNFVMPSNWTTYWQWDWGTYINNGNESTISHTIELKQENGVMSLRVQVRNITLEISPAGKNGFSFKENGKIIETPENGIYTDLNPYIKTLIVPNPRILILRMKHKFHIAFDGNSARLEVLVYSRFGPKLMGKCTEKTLNDFDI